MLKLYSYYRSSAAFRVRIALHYKALEFEYLPVHLLKNEQHSESFRKINPMEHVPALDHDGFVLGESMAILTYLDDIAPEKKLFPAAPKAKARVVQICEIINSGIQPLQNLKIQQFLEGRYGFTKEQSLEYIKHWMMTGLAALEKALAVSAGVYAVGDQFTAADCLVVPQCVTMQRFKIDLEPYPTLQRVFIKALEEPAVKRGQPDQQPDFQA